MYLYMTCTKKIWKLNKKAYKGLKCNFGLDVF